MREIKFKVWDFGGKQMIGWEWLEIYPDGIRVIDEEGNMPDLQLSEPMQFTGLKDKDGLQEVYEDDIIDEYGNIKGNTYEMDAGKTDFVIQGFGNKDWGATYKEAVGRGCKDTQRYADTDEVRKLE